MLVSYTSLVSLLYGADSIGNLLKACPILPFIGNIGSITSLKSDSLTYYLRFNNDCQESPNWQLCQLLV
jgi:hypothetical protein